MELEDGPDPATLLLLASNLNLVEKQDDDCLARKNFEFTDILHFLLSNKTLTVQKLSMNLLDRVTVENSESNRVKSGFREQIPF